MYRAVAYMCREKGVAPAAGAQLESLLEAIRIELLPPAQGEDDVRVIVDGREVGKFLRTQEMGMLASQVSAVPLVRRTLTRLQQQIGTAGRIVAEGRDTGTVVFPDAAWKFFLEASPEVRVHRRAEQLRSKGEKVDEQLLLAQIIQRDKDDRERTIAPLKAAPDALTIDSTGMPVEEVVRLMYEKILLSSCCREE
jgi:cytidylate kinase